MSAQNNIEQVIIVCRQLYAKGLVTATDGNVSIRLETGNFITTRSGVNKGLVTYDDLVEVNNMGEIVNPAQSHIKPSTEFGMHLFIYQNRPDVNAVVHAHPTYATGFAAARIPMDACVFPEVIVGLGTIPLAEYATPSTSEVAQSIAPYVKTSDAILLANHGVVTYGRDVIEAFYKMEKVEHAAHILFVSKMLGGESRLSVEHIEKLKAISGYSSGKDSSSKSPCEPAGNDNSSNEDSIREVIGRMLKNQ